MKKLLRVLGIASLSLALLSTSVGEVAAKSDNSNKNKPNVTFSKEISPKIKNRLDEVTNELPEVKAWEVDLKGNKTPVTPLSERDSLSLQESSGDTGATLSTPDDGYSYVYDHYDLDSTSQDYYYELLGGVYTQNKSSESIVLEYTQEQASTTNWNVTSNVSGETKVGNDFLGEVTVSVGVSVARDKTYSESTTVKHTMTVKSGYWGSIDRYSRAHDGNGQLVYKKYTSTGTMVGYYYESGGGWAVSEAQTSYDVDDGPL